MESTLPKGKYVINTQGKKTGVLLSLKQYQQIVEDLHDLTILASRRDETPVTLDEMRRRLQCHGQV